MTRSGSFTTIHGGTPYYGSAFFVDRNTMFRQTFVLAYLRMLSNSQAITNR